MNARCILILLAALTFALVGCSDDEDPPVNNDISDLSDTDNTTSDAGDSSGEADADASGQEDVGPVESCDEIGAQACFANTDCAATERCENKGTDELPVACCVEGERGTKAAGETCTEEDDGPECASGICITGDTSSLCSTACTSVDDCPEGMKDCRPIAFSGSDDDWCFPTE